MASGVNIDSDLDDARRGASMDAHDGHVSSSSSSPSSSSSLLTLTLVQTDEAVELKLKLMWVSIGATLLLAPLLFLSYRLTDAFCCLLILLLFILATKENGYCNQSFIILLFILAVVECAYSTIRLTLLLSHASDELPPQSSKARFAVFAVAAVAGPIVHSCTSVLSWRVYADLRLLVHRSSLDGSSSVPPHAPPSAVDDHEREHEHELNRDGNERAQHHSSDSRGESDDTTHHSPTPASSIRASMSLPYAHRAHSSASLSPPSRTHPPSVTLSPPAPARTATSATPKHGSSASATNVRGPTSLTLTCICMLGMSCFAIIDPSSLVTVTAAEAHLPAQTPHQPIAQPSISRTSSSSSASPSASSSSSPLPEPDIDVSDFTPAPSPLSDVLTHHPLPLFDEELKHPHPHTHTHHHTHQPRHRHPPPPPPVPRRRHVGKMKSKTKSKSQSKSKRTIRRPKLTKNPARRVASPSASSSSAARTGDVPRFDAGEVSPGQARQAQAQGQQQHATSEKQRTPSQMGASIAGHPLSTQLDHRHMNYTEWRMEQARLYELQKQQYAKLVALQRGEIQPWELGLDGESAAKGQQSVSGDASSSPPPPPPPSLEELRERMRQEMEKNGGDEGFDPTRMSNPLMMPPMPSPFHDLPPPPPLPPGHIPKWKKNKPSLRRRGRVAASSMSTDKINQLQSLMPSRRGKDQRDIVDQLRSEVSASLNSESATQLLRDRIASAVKEHLASMSTEELLQQLNAIKNQDLLQPGKPRAKGKGKDKGSRNGKGKRRRMAKSAASKAKTQQAGRSTRPRSRQPLTSRPTTKQRP